MEKCKNLRSLSEMLEDGFATYKIGYEGNTEATFLLYDMNEVYKSMSCSDVERCIGKAIKEIYADSKYKEFEISKKLGELLIGEDSMAWEEYGPSNGKWYRIKIFKMESELIGGIFRDITKDKLIDFEDKKSHMLNKLEAGVYYDKFENKGYADYSKTTLKLSDKESILRKTRKIARVGNWEIIPGDDRIWASGSALEIYGLGEEDGVVPYNLVKECTIPRDKERLAEAMVDVIYKGAEYDVHFSIMNMKDGTLRHLHSYAETDTSEDGKVERVAGVLMDVTDIVENEIKLEKSYEELNQIYHELENSEHQLRLRYDDLLKHKNMLQLSEKRYKTLVENSEDMIYSLDCNGKLITINSRFSQVLGLGEEDIIGKKMSELINAQYMGDEWEIRLKKVLATREPQSFEDWSSDDSIFSVTLSPIINENNEVIGITGTNHDISEIKKNEKIIMKMAFYDDLTNLPNRLMLSDRLNKGIARAKRKSTKLAILFIDMDNFKRVNDTLGHGIGDELLKETSKRLQHETRECDTVARISGDEFALMISDVTSIESIIPLLERIIGIFTEPFLISNRLINMTASIGISMYPEDGEQVEDLLRSSDTAMYKSKELGKNRYQFYNIGMKRELLKKLNIEVMLNKAILEDEFILYYQPQISAVSGKLRGFEALIRWNNPELGFLMPNDFIAIAEEVGLISTIGEWVLNKACEFNSKLNNIHGTDHIIAVNISPLQLKQREFYDIVVKALSVSGIKPENLELEVTENIFIDNFDFAVKLLKDLRGLGVRIALDDFGTGYSSLSYLKKLPINLLKIDKTFVSEIDYSDNENDLTRPIISIAHKLNIETLAEGVEERFQLDFLVDAECDNIQGYYFGEPLKEEDILFGKELTDLI